MPCPDGLGLPGIPTTWLPPRGSLYAPPRCIRCDVKCCAVMMQCCHKGEGPRDEGGVQDPKLCHGSAASAIEQSGSQQQPHPQGRDPQNKTPKEQTATEHNTAGSRNPQAKWGPLRRACMGAPHDSGGPVQLSPQSGDGPMDALGRPGRPYGDPQSEWAKGPSGAGLHRCHSK